MRHCFHQSHPQEPPFPKAVPLVMEVQTYHKIPKNATKAVKKGMEEKGILPAKKPDVDNLLKIIGDSLNGFAYHDDSQIVEAKIEKFYGTNPRVEVRIWEK